MPWRSPRSGFILLGLDVARQRESEDAMSLPPLPRNKALEQACGFDALHYGEALAYGQACREAALEEAAMAAESGFKYALDGYQIADKIRSLK
jgi:hypothetical protein